MMVPRGSYGPDRLQDPLYLLARLYAAERHRWPAYIADDADPSGDAVNSDRHVIAATTLSD